jgi:hypothetical protein
VELDADRRHERGARPDFGFVIVPQRQAELAVRFDHGEHDSVEFDVAVADALRAQPLGPADLEHQVVRVVPTPILSVSA